MKTKLWLSLFSLAALLLAACDKPAPAPTGPDTVVARINGVPITAGDVEFSLSGPHGTGNPEKRKVALERMILGELYYQKGVELKLDQDKKFQGQLKLMELRMDTFKRQEMQRRIYNQEIAAKFKVSDEELKAYYETHKDEIATEWHLASLKFRTPGTAQETLGQIKGGKTFEELARKNNPKQKTNGSTPGDLGFVKWAQMPVEWYEAVKILKPNETSGIVHGARTGIRIFKLLESKKTDVADFEQVKGAIRRRVEDSKLLEARKNYEKRLREAAKIETFAP